MSETKGEYRLAPRARTDLEEIWVYTYETWSLEQADKYHAQIIDAFELLAQNPDKGRDMNHIRPGYLRVSAGSHFIFYRQTLYGVEIIRILHQKRDILRHL